MKIILSELEQRIIDAIGKESYPISMIKERAGIDDVCTATVRYYINGLIDLGVLRKVSVRHGYTAETLFYELQTDKSVDKRKCKRCEKSFLPETRFMFCCKKCRESNKRDD